MHDHTCATRRCRGRVRNRDDPDWAERGTNIKSNHFSAFVSSFFKSSRLLFSCRLGPRGSDEIGIFFLELHLPQMLAPACHYLLASAVPSRKRRPPTFQIDPRAPVQFLLIEILNIVSYANCLFQGRHFLVLDSLTLLKSSHMADCPLGGTSGELMQLC